MMTPQELLWKLDSEDHLSKGIQKAKWYNDLHRQSVLQVLDVMSTLNIAHWYMGVRVEKSPQYKLTKLGMTCFQIHGSVVETVNYDGFIEVGGPMPNGVAKALLRDEMFTRFDSWFDFSMTHKWGEIYQVRVQVKQETLSLHSIQGDLTTMHCKMRLS
jgi:hypothetical protein